MRRAAANILHRRWASRRSCRGETKHGLVADGDGWFVINATESRWNDTGPFGFYCNFEGKRRFKQLGLNLNVLEPGQAIGLYHRERAQEDFLVLAGECLLLVEGQERPLRAWDFVHCPPETNHMIVGAGDGPAVVLAVGARGRGRSGIVYPADPLALEHGVGVEQETTKPRGGVRALPAPHPLPRTARAGCPSSISACRLAEIADSFFRPAVNDLVPYEPGKPVEEVQRELGLERVVKLASNEGPYGPFPAAREAIERATAELNRYPDGGAYRLRAALAERFDLRFEEVAVGAGSDGLVDCLTQAALEPGDEIVCGWPSFPSYVIDARKVGAVPRTVPLRDGRYDLEAMLEAIGPRTKIAYLCLPNNPTGTTNTRAELDEWFERVPEHVVTVLDQAYAEYIDDPDYPDGVEGYLKQGRRAVVLRTFSKIYGLAGLRVGYALAPAEIVTAIGKVRRAFDITTPAQEAALASLDSPASSTRRRDENADGRAELERILRDARPRAGRARGRELPLRRGRRGLAPVLRAAAPRGRDRAARRTASARPARCA